MGLGFFIYCSFDGSHSSTVKVFFHGSGVYTFKTKTFYFIYTCITHIIVSKNFFKNILSYKLTPKLKTCIFFLEVMNQFESSTPGMSSAVSTNTSSSCRKYNEREREKEEREINIIAEFVISYYRYHLYVKQLTIYHILLLFRLLFLKGC